MYEVNNIHKNLWHYNSSRILASISSLLFWGHHLDSQQNVVYGMELSAPYPTLHQKDQASTFICPRQSVAPVLPLGTRCSFWLPFTLC
jgi:hypothetical protein